MQGKWNQEEQMEFMLTIQLRDGASLDKVVARMRADSGIYGSRKGVMTEMAESRVAQWLAGQTCVPIPSIFLANQRTMNTLFSFSKLQLSSFASEVTKIYLRVNCDIWMKHST
jgi:hypothetical protein